MEVDDPPVPATQVASASDIDMAGDSVANGAGSGNNASSPADPLAADNAAAPAVPNDNSAVPDANGNLPEPPVVENPPAAPENQDIVGFPISFN